MAIARWKDLCIDAVDPEPIGIFYAGLLGLALHVREDGQVSLEGPSPAHRVWINRIPEERTAKNRMHLDVNLMSVQQAMDLGADRRVELEGWTVLTDPEGGEFCVFERPEPPAAGTALYEIVVDAVDARAQARWWATLLGTEAHDDPEGRHSWVEPVPGAPFECLVFVEVPEPRTGKNRVHVDLLAADPADLLEAGAAVLWDPADGRPWTVMADPEQNEFCVFVDS